MVSRPLATGTAVEILRGVTPAMAVVGRLGGTAGGVAGGVAGGLVGGVADVAVSGREGVWEAEEGGWGDVSKVTRGYL